MCAKKIGRPVTVGEGVRVTIYMRPEDLERVDAMAGRCGIPRSKLIVNCLNGGIEDLELFERMGGLRFRDSARLFLKWIQGGRSESVFDWIADW